VKPKSEWNFSGRKPIAEGSWFKRTFCWHRESEGQPLRSHWYFPDIYRVQCERCGWWHVSKQDSRVGELIREMFK
jgi:hypothetical protein